MEIFEPQVVKKLTIPSQKSFGKYSGLSKAKTEGEGYDLYGVRPYRAGESVKKIDWNATAKTGELHIKATHGEISIPVYIFLDKSPSMNYGFEESKYSIACSASSLVAQVALKDQNPVSMVTNTSTTSITKLGGRKKTYFNSLTMFKTPNTGKDTLAGLVLNKISRPGIPSGAVVVVSDFLETPELLKAIKQLSQRHKVTAIHVFDPSEYNLPVDKGFLYMQDPETLNPGNYFRVKINSKIKNQYDLVMKTKWEEIEAFMKQNNVYHIPISTKDNIVKILALSLNDNKVSRIGRVKT